MRAIITGATGGLGRNLGEFLLKEGWDIIGFGRNQKIGDTLGYKFKAFDLSSKEETLNAFEEVDVVFHCAARSSPWGEYQLFYQDNVQATQNVLDAMEHYNIPKLVHVSTPSIYFNFSDQEQIKESFKPQKFVNAYAKTKYEAEQLVLSSDIKSVIIRPRGIFGEYDTVLVPRLEKISKRGSLPVIKNKKVLVDVTYVGNVVHALYLSATKELASKSIYNITNDEPLEIKHLFTMVMKSINKEVTFKPIGYRTMMFLATALERLSKLGFSKEPIVTKYGVGLIAYSQTLDISKAKEELGYTPVYTIKEGLERYAKSRD